MKLKRFLILAMIGGAAWTLRGQDAAQPIVDLRSKTNAPVASPTISPALPELSQLDEAFKQTSLGKDADEFRLRIEWRKLQNRVVNNPEVVAAKVAAEDARTDLEKRQRLRDYYNIYYGQMRALASSEDVRKALDASKAEHLALINQPRVRHLTDGSLPTPTPGRKHKKKDLP
jgi:hypothetical protein